MLRGYGYWLLFLSSYSPLFLILMVRSVGNWIMFGIFGVAGAAGIGWVMLALRSSRSLNPETYQVAIIQDRSTDVTAYISSYIVPFVLVNSGDWRDIVALVLLFLVVGYIYIHSDMVYVNPTLSLVGYRAYAITSPSAVEHILISKHRPNVGVVRAHQFSNAVLVEVG